MTHPRPDQTRSARIRSALKWFVPVPPKPYASLHAGLVKRKFA